jgi:uncharacterized membrane protein YcaP (DUF421 family)
MEPFEWQRILFGEEHPWHYVFEIMFRTAVMYTVLVVFFKVTGKTGIRQLSAFDLILIIGLGSAAGDPMFYDDIPLLHAVTVFATILSLYLLINRLTQRSHAADKVLEGETTCVLHDGVIDYPRLMAEGLTLMQFYSELRQEHVTHLGQVRLAYIEISGETSVFFVEDDGVKPGLPILPERLKEEQPRVEAGHHSCVQCGYTREFEERIEEPCCPSCKCEKWVRSWTERRVA